MLYFVSNRPTEIEYAGWIFYTPKPAKLEGRGQDEVSPPNLIKIICYMAYYA